ncbi:hypothetical protein QYF36_009425 [Acer negundo]|nr:hypothetical protein QYF36_009425 [Acer negundo]
MVFGSADVFRQATRAHAVTYRKEVKFHKNDANRVRAVCKAQGCKWFVFASWCSKCNQQGHNMSTCNKRAGFEPVVRNEADQPSQCTTQTETTPTYSNSKRKRTQTNA